MSGLSTKIQEIVDSINSTIKELQSQVSKLEEWKDSSDSVASFATAAKKSEENAAESELNAKTYENNITNMAKEISENLESVKNYQSKTATSEENAATSEANAKKYSDIASQRWIEIKEIEYVENIEIKVNTISIIDVLDGNLTVTLSKEVEDFKSEWIFRITQDPTYQYKVTLPEAIWMFDSKPSFDIGTITEVKFYYIDNTLYGDWVVIK